MALRAATPTSPPTSAVARSSVAATVRYEDDEGAVSRERRSYRLIEVDGVLKIDDSAVIG